MAKLTEMLNQIEKWVWQYESAASMSPGLGLDEIKVKSKDLSFHLPEEVIELYQWRNGGRYSFLPSPCGGYDLQHFLSFEDAISLSKEWSQHQYYNDNAFPLFYLEDVLYWTAGSSENQEFAPIYYKQEPIESDAKSDYPSLTAMLEYEIKLLKEIWQID